MPSRVYLYTFCTLTTVMVACTHSAALRSTLQLIKQQLKLSTRHWLTAHVSMSCKLTSAALAPSYYRVSAVPLIKRSLP